MKILDKLFSQGKKKKKPEDIMDIAKIIGPLIDKMAHEIFMLHKKRLFIEPITYIVPAVWGAKQGGELTATQKEINRRVVPVIEQIFEALALKDPDVAQEYAIGFLIRGSIISKIAYIIEMARNQVTDRINLMEQEAHVLENLEPVGNA